MKKITLLCLITVFSATALCAQDNPIGFFNNNPLWGQFYHLEDKPVAYILKDTPYTTEEYQEGTISIHGEIAFSAPIRYNATKDLIEFLDEDNVKRELLRRSYITATFENGARYHVNSYWDEEHNTEKNGYFTSLNEGETQLLFRPKKAIRMGKKKYGNTLIEVSVKYSDLSAFYLKKGEKPSKKVKLNKKTVLALLGDKRPALEYFIDKEKLNLRKEKDVVTLLDYYNSLQS